MVPVTDIDKIPAVLAGPALFHQLVHQLGPGYRAFDGAYVKLRPHATPQQFVLRAQALERRFPGTGGQVFLADERSQAATVEQAIRPEAVALAIFALVLAVTALLIVGQAAVRLLVGGSSDNPTLAALGMTRGQLTATGLIEVGATATAGVRIALEPGRGRSAVPVRSALAGTALSVLAVAAAFTFGANLLHLVHTPRLYGQGWDAAIDLQFQTITPQQTEHPCSKAARRARITR